jgi:2-succinyl-5-enolpyruvyl-6-hydroxy-3-cyclohexene-1-carboxylate synthase
MIQSAKRNVRALVYIAQNKGVKHVVFSPGSRNAPLIIGFTNNPHFNCLTVPDERSAAFVAMGIAQATQTPVIVCCTSGSAAVNFYPAIVEAFYQQIPLIALTADRPSEWVDQGDGQTIRQENVFANHINYACTLYKDVDDSELQVYNERVINEAINTALLKSGPVHINVPFQEPLYQTVEHAHDRFKLIEQVHIKPEVEASWTELGERWQAARKKIVLIGQHREVKGLTDLFAALNKDPGVLILTESTSNIHITDSIGGIDKVINTISEKEKLSLKADILLTIDGAVVSKMIKAHFRIHQPQQHWHVSQHLPGPDTYQSLTHNVVAEPRDFLKFLTSLAVKNHNDFKTKWLKTADVREQRHEEYAEMVPFGDFKVFHHLLRSLPRNIALHIASSSPIRYVQLFNTGREVPHFCNRGAAGIDGCSSTAVGYAIGSEKAVILITGDIGFVYDSNAFFHNHVPKSFKVLVINNGGGNIFRIIPGPATTGKLEDYFEAHHQVNLAGIAKTFNMEFKSVHTEEELVAILPQFFDPTGTLQILEVRTDKVESPQQLKNYFKYLEYGTYGMEDG